jgi:hypothetical protein
METRRDSGNDGEQIGTGKCVAVRPTAIQVAIDGKDDLLWIPTSCLHDDSEVYQAGTTGKIVVLSWWAKDRRLGERWRDDVKLPLPLKAPTKKQQKEQKARAARNAKALGLK